MSLSLVGYLVVALVSSSAYALRPRQQRWLHLFAVAVASVPLSILVEYGLVSMGRMPSVRYDQYLFVVDRAWGEPSFCAGRLLLRCGWLKAVCQLDYGLVSLAALAVIACTFALRGVKEGYRAFLTALALPLCAVPLYRLLPASGPAYAFAGFPNTVPAHLVPHALWLKAAPNCFPSVHMAMALFVLAFAWRWRAGRALGIAHLALTALATLGLGEHYLLDLLAAVPYTLALTRATQALLKARWRPAEEGFQQPDLAA